ncbi:hypothetical protein CC86DRAFT_74439 [Ophiobolus disseminans]|uniref:Uncharacterized protein n=1 Tax=Ophiobolus disseminans TaxID=1469910 RepID=A0A6A6ZPF4_9PLEO|nr:hypothetical protein CC86DRAFT_74439 [Ophiobolus disseminans]
MICEPMGPPLEQLPIRAIGVRMHDTSVGIMLGQVHRYRDQLRHVVLLPRCHHPLQELEEVLAREVDFEVFEGRWEDSRDRRELPLLVGSGEELRIWDAHMLQAPEAREGGGIDGLDMLQHAVFKLFRYAESEGLDVGAGPVHAPDKGCSCPRLVELRTSRFAVLSCSSLKTKQASLVQRAKKSIILSSISEPPGSSGLKRAVVVRWMVSLEIVGLLPTPTSGTSIRHLVLICRCLRVDRQGIQYGSK